MLFQETNVFPSKLYFSITYINIFLVFLITAKKFTELKATYWSFMLPWWLRW